MKKVTTRRRALLFAALVTIAGCKDKSPDVKQGVVEDVSSKAQVGQTHAATISLSSAPINDGNWQYEYGRVDPRAQMDGNSSISTARSKEEAEWLKRRGFVSQSAAEKFKKMGFKEVDALARAGNAEAILYISDMLISNGEGSKVSHALDGMIKNTGSIPALELRARYKSSLISAVPGDIPTSSIAWRDTAVDNVQAKIDVAADYFTAYLLGDYRGSQMVVAMFSDGQGVPPAVYTESMKRVQEIVNTRSKNPGLRPYSLDPRPIDEGVNGAIEGFGAHQY